MTNNMKKKILLIAVLSASILGFYAFKTTTLVKFKEGNWVEGREESKKERKFYFVDFDASWCVNCRNMDESTYIDQRLAEYMDKNAVAVRMDYSSFDGLEKAQEYNVQALPTMLIISPDGKLLKKLEGFHSAQKILSIFKTLEQENPSVSPIAKAEELTPSAPDMRPDEKPRKPDPTPARPIAELPIEKPAETMPKKQPSTAMGVSNIGLYEFSIKRQKPEGFGIQVGVFYDYENVIKESEKLEMRTGKKVVLSVANINGKLAYRLLLGVFSTNEEAEKFLPTLKAKGYNSGIVRDLLLLK